MGKADETPSPPRQEARTTKKEERKKSVAGRHERQADIIEKVE